MLGQYFESLESGILSSIEKDGGKASPRKLYALEIARLGRRLYDGGHKVAWCGVAAPFDLLNAMGLTSCFVEFVGAMLASTGMAGNIIEQADHWGYSSDACSYHRSVTGAALAGLMPVPEILVGTTCPCTGGLGVIENLARHFGKPLFVLNIPQNDTVEDVRYLADQLRDLVGFASGHTGIPFDQERLTRAIENTNAARELFVEIFDLASRVPSPASSKDLNNFMISLALLLGTRECVDLARAFKDEFARRVETGSAGVKGEEIRLLWIQNRIQFKNPIEKMLEDEFRACIVIDELNDIYWDPIDPDDPFEGIARRCILIPFNGPSSRRIEHLKKLALTYRVHGAINPCNWGCRQGTGMRGLIEAGLREVGVPVLNLEVDCVDDRKFTEGQFRTRIEAFMEMIGSNRSSRRDS
ncbi:MAG TPA: 2-hydroxyacyl-CoA dehydratase family protein [Deltaproteobacteria bacterium]|nr:2-hydroxyacyl-CoA dehydratase family protein [Deltaproteobacteria bacterium]HPP81137.1 2-hydroxyacyl-CoA dehydratase family protein [Deltaproteobacteria bacterium]